MAVASNAGAVAGVPGALPERHAAGPKTCPSAPPEAGSVLLGVVTAPGVVAYLNPHPPVTPALLESFADGGVTVENRLRFACACAEQGCAQWSTAAGGAGRCGLVDHALEALAIEDGPDALPRCGIRADCRWFAQHGRRACAACPQIIRRPAAA